MHLNRRGLIAGGLGGGIVVTAASTTTAYADRRRSELFTRRVFRGEFTDPATPDWHYLPFSVGRGISEIRVRYDFEPTDTGVGLSFNVVDIGIFDPSGRDLGDEAGFRGWSGGARRCFRISRHRATPGYLAGPLTPGRWHVILGPYLITPPGTPYRVVVDLIHGPRRGRRFQPSPAPTAVAGTTPGWYRGDLHTHTVHSDGRWTPRTLAGAARDAGLDFIGSSEHNTSSAQLAWGKHAPDDLLVVAGEEVTTRDGHWLAMGLPAGTWIDWRYRPEDDRLGEFTDRVRELGGVAIACHPFNPVPSIRWGFGTDFEHLDAFEIWNGPWTGDDETSVAHWDRMLRQGRYVPAVGNSDTHHDGQRVGLAQSVMRLESLSTAAVVAAVKGGHLWVAESSAVSLDFTAAVDDATASCGDTLEAAPEELVTVTLSAAGVPGCVGQLLGPTGVIAGALADGEGSLTVTTEQPAALLAYVRAEVRRPDGQVESPVEGLVGAQMVALTNPVFVTAPAEA